MMLTPPNPASRYCLPLVCMLILSVSVNSDAGHATDAPATAFDKRIDLDLWDKHLGDAVSQITERSNVDVVIDTDFIRPKEFVRHKLYLRARQIRTRMAIELLARAIGCRYRATGPGSVLLGGGYSWMKEKQRILIPRFSLDSLLAPGQSVKSLQSTLDEIVKTNALMGSSCCLRIEENYVGENATTKQLVAVLPTTLKQYLEQALAAMSKPGQVIRAPEMDPLDPEEIELISKLRKPVVIHCRNWSVEQIIQDIALQTGIYVAFAQPPGTKGKFPRITMNLGEVSARRAIETLAKKLGFGGFEYMPDKCVWLSPDPRKWTRASTREFMWDNMLLKSYAAKSIAAAMGSGEVLSHHIRHHVCVDTWKDPATAVVYHRKSGNLLVLAPPNVQKMVMQELVKLRDSKNSKSRKPLP